MRILAVVPLYPPHSRVGAWLSTHECLAYMAARGHRVDVITTLGARDPYVHDGVHVHPGRNPLELIDTADVVVSHLGDDGHAHSLAVNARRPSVRMVHGEKGPGAAGLYRATLAVFNSNALKRFIGWVGPSVVIHPPVNLADYRTTPGDRVTLINLTADKGGEVFGLLAASLPQMRFLGVRGGYGKQVIQYCPNVDTIWPTQNPRDDIYARTRILLMPSLHETWGRTGLEAMASGIPVVAHPTDGLVESLGDAGIFVDRADLAGWRRELMRLADPDEWFAASQRALARAATFDHSIHLERFAAELEHVNASTRR